MQHAGDMVNDICLIKNLFKECRKQSTDYNPDESTDDEDNIEVKSSVNPSSFGKRQKKGKESVYKPVENEKLTREEFENSQKTLLELSREVAKYDIVYRQAVGAEDVFLQMGGRTPATSSCEDMIMTIHLPGENRTAMDLNVNHTEIKLTSPKYKLEMPFPHPIDPQRSSAQWDSEKEQLVLTLRMDREFDYVNF